LAYTTVCTTVQAVIYATTEASTFKFGEQHAESMSESSYRQKNKKRSCRTERPRDALCQ